MTKYIKFLVTFSVVFLLVCAIILSLSINEEEHIEIKSTDTSSYMVKAYDGQIAIFESSKNTPLKIAEVYTEFLPPNDKELLEKGITVDTIEDAEKILSDYIK